MSAEFNAEIALDFEAGTMSISFPTSLDGSLKELGAV
jgi:hypothetical protein